MDVTTEPLGGAPTGQDVRLTVRLTDAASGAPLAAANPAAWLSLNRRGSPPSEPVCRREVAAYLGGNPFVRPDVDLTGFTLVVMNRDPTVTVLDPQGGFGGSRMLAMLPLESPGVDMAVGLMPPRLYVTEPVAKRLAVIDTERWQQPVSVTLADAPAALVLQHDGRRLWAAAVRDGAVTAMATDDLAVAARIPIGRGAHLLAMTKGRSQAAGNQPGRWLRFRDRSTGIGCGYDGVRGRGAAGDGDVGPGGACLRRGRGFDRCGRSHARHAGGAHRWRCGRHRDRHLARWALGLRRQPSAQPGIDLRHQRPIAWCRP